MRPIVLLLTAFAAAATLPINSANADDRLTAAEGRIRVTAEDGTPRPDVSVIGREIAIGDPAAGGYIAKITGMIDDPHAAMDPVTLYQVRYRDPASGTWRELCKPGPHGLALAVPVAGTWSATGRFRPSQDGSFTFNCTSGAHVKCLRIGYAPWKTDADGRSLAPLHQACTRMMRADYCGTGQPFTVAGTRIQVLDPTRETGTLHGRFEAVWGPDGAICISRVRVPRHHPLTSVLAACPRLAETMPECGADILGTSPEALLGNRS